MVNTENSDETSPEEGSRRTGLLLVAAGLAQFVVCVDYFSVAIALPAMARDLGIRAIDLQWVITGYVLSCCAVLAVAGPLGDRFGRKRLLLVGIVLFGLFSIWAGLARSAEELVAARIALGIGAGLLFPLATAVVSHASSERLLARNIALLSGVATLGTAAGPVLGGVLTEFLDWRWIFFVNLPLCLVPFLMVLFFARESRDPECGARLDWTGVVLLLVGIAALSVGIDRVPHWPTWWWVGTLAAGVVLLSLFALLELRLRAPIIDLRLFMNRDFLGFSLSGMLSNGAWCVLVFVATLQLQKVLGFSVLESGLIYLYLSGSVAASSFIAPYLQRRIGTVNVVRIALLCQLTGIGLLFFRDTEAWLSAGLLVAGFGCGWGWSMSQAGAIRTVPRAKSGLGSGSVLTLMIMAGNTAIVVVAMLIDLYPDGTAGLATGIRESFLVGALIAGAGLLPACLVLRRLRGGASG